MRRLSREQVRIVAGNSWLAEAARKSTLFSRFDVTTIHLGIDTGIFRPRDRNALRASLEIPETAFVVLFATNEIHNISNGFHLLLKALKHVRGTRPVYLLSIGDRELRVHTPFKHIHLGRLTCDEMRSVFYNAGDCLVIPSVQEISGLTALEAMSCETPVAGFATGAITDMIKPGKTGLLIEPGNTAELAESIHWLMEHPREGRAMGEEARMLVKQEFTIDKQAREYTNLYNDLEQKIAISTW